MTSLARWGTAIGAALLAALAGRAVQADAAADFYKGKRITLVIGTGVGGSYDINGRLLARHYARHIPGRPDIIVQNVPGAGSRKAATYVYNVAPQDGTVLAQVLNTLPLLQAIGKLNARFDTAKFQWIGNLSDDVSLVDVWHTASATTLDGVRRTEVIMGATSPGSLGAMIPTIMNNLLGTRFKIVTGYKKGVAIDLAVQRGEVHGRAGASWTVLAKTYPHLIRENKLIHLAQMGPRRAPGLEDVPLLTELARTEEERRILTVFSSPSSVGKPTVAGPGVPGHLVTALRRAYDATMKDPAFLADAEKQGLAIGPVSGEALQKIVGEAVNAPAEVAARLKAALSQKGMTVRKGGNN